MAYGVQMVRMMEMEALGLVGLSRWMTLICLTLDRTRNMAVFQPLLIGPGIIPGPSLLLGVGAQLSGGLHTAGWLINSVALGRLWRDPATCFLVPSHLGCPG